MDNHPSKISNISSITPLFSNREIKRNDYIVPNEILKNKQKFINLVHSYNNKLADYSSRLMVSSSTLAVTLRNIFKYHPNYRFTYDELFNMLLKALDTHDFVTPKASIENERATRKQIAADEKALAGKVKLVDRFSSAQQTTQTNTDFDESALRNDLNSISYLKNNPQYPHQLQNNKNFASWLLNNPAALGSMLSKPQFTSFFVSAFNPRMVEKMSPIFFSQMASLIGQLLKLRQGKASGTSMGIEEEEHLEDARKSSEMDSDNHNHRIVDEVKNVINIIPIKSVKDFLLEAERFVEEEIAMFYSLQKHLEKEILKQMNKNKK